MTGQEHIHGAASPDRHPAVSFGVFELDRHAGELRKRGVKVHLQEKPLRILEVLLEHPGEAVTRDELRTRLWPGDVFVDFDHSLNSAVSKLRDALHDTAASPRFIETLPRGYRFIAPVSLPAGWVGDAHAADARDPGPAPAASASPRRPWLPWAIGLGGVAAAVALGTALWLRPAGAPRSPAADTIALVVLPFQNLSADPEQEYFSDGITEEMIAQLGRVDPEHVSVIARTSAMHYKHTDKRIDQIGAELGVNFILEGSVRRAASRVRVTAQLVRVRDQVRVWAQSYERDLGDVLALQTEVAQSVAREIAVTFNRASGAPAPPRVDPAVYEAYLRGRYFLDKSPNPAALAKSIEYFDEALRLDPANAAAYAGLADAYGILGWTFSAGLAPREAYPKALAAAERALALDERLAAAHVALARIRSKYEWNWQAAEASFKRALELDPNASAAHESYFDFLSAMGRNDEAFAELQRAAVLDPLSLTVAYDFGMHFARTGDYPLAIERLKRASELDPTSGLVHYLLGQIHTNLRHFDVAIAEYEKAVQLSPEAPPYMAALGHVRALAGDRAAALRVLEELQTLSKRTYVSPHALAVLYMGLGDKGKALDLLETAYRERDPWLSVLGPQPRFQVLRAEPRFQALLQKLGLTARPAPQTPGR